MTIFRIIILQISQFSQQIRKMLSPQNLFYSSCLTFISAKRLYVFFSFVLVLKRIILLFTTLTCEEYKSNFYWFRYYISSSFEKLRFVPATIMLGISITDLATVKISPCKIIKISPSTKINLPENESRENESPLGSNFGQFKVFKMSVKLCF